MLPLEDWIVPVHYLRSSISFPALKKRRKSKARSLDALLDRMRSNPHKHGEAENKLAPDRRFIGRDAAFYCLELALRWQRVGASWAGGDRQNRVGEGVWSVVAGDGRR
jgi:hypothetical protein